MIVLADTDTLRVITSGGADVDVLASYTDADPDAAGMKVTDADQDPTSITTATTTTIVAAPTTGLKRSVSGITIRNIDTSANDVTVTSERSGTPVQVIKRTLLAGDSLEYEDGVGWVHITAGRTDRSFRLSGADYTNATTSFTDITGLGCPVVNGKTYNFEAHLYIQNNATTTGSRIGINGPTLTNILLASFGRIVTLSASVDAQVVNAQNASAVTAVDTSVFGATLTGNVSITPIVISGQFTAGADGTFILRGQSEIAVAAGLTVKIGSWLHVWEPTG